jgi:hypothetical protein
LKYDEEAQDNNPETVTMHEIHEILGTVAIHDPLRVLTQELSIHEPLRALAQEIDHVAYNVTKDLFKDPLKILKERIEAEEEILCIICCERPRQLLFYPCGHIVVCGICFVKSCTLDGFHTAKCYICKAPIKDTVQYIFS